MLGWTRKQWKHLRMWKRAGVSEENIARLALSLDQETVQKLKDNSAAEVLVDNFLKLITIRIKRPFRPDLTYKFFDPTMPGVL